MQKKLYLCSEINQITTIMNNLFKGAALFIGGAAVGAAVALLLTPKTGEEVRKEIADLAQDLKKSAQDYCEQVKQELTQQVEAVAEAAEAKLKEPQKEA